jgi:hypothetical protein
MKTTKIILFTLLLSCIYGLNVKAQDADKVVLTEQTSETNNLHRKIVSIGKESTKVSAKTNCAKSKLDLKDNELWWGYFNGDYDGSDPFEWSKIGYGCAITYGCCIKILSQNDFNIGKGKTIEGIKFAFSDIKNIDDVSIWMSTALPKDKTAEDANICSMKIDKSELVDAINSKDGNFINEIRFSKPYTIGDNDVYIGYTFKVTQIDDSYDQTPVVFCSDPERITTQKNGFYWKYDDSEEWDEEKEDVLAIQALFSGDFLKNAIHIQNEFDDIPLGINSEIKLPLTLNNMGTNGFNDFSYTVSANGKTSEETTVTTDKKIQGIGTRYIQEIPIHSGENNGISNIKINITKVNGQSNESDKSECDGDLIVVKKIIDRKVLVEDYSGTWGKGSPFGLINLSKLKEMYGDKIVPVSIHIGSQDPMECKDYKTYTSKYKINSIPSVTLDRSIFGLYPYYGSYEGEYFKFAFPDDIAKAQNIISVASVETNGTLNEEQNTVEADSKVKFLYSSEKCDYALVYVLTEDSLRNESWTQSNGLTQYAGMGIETYDSLFDKWINGTNPMKDIIYDNVAIATIGTLNGIKNSITAPIKEDEIKKT